MSRTKEVAVHELPGFFQAMPEPHDGVPGIPSDHPGNHQGATPAAFEESSYLYIRSYDTDLGTRPWAGPEVFWNSPDITLSPVAAATAYTKTLEAGQTYLLECTVRNRGDLMVPSANVEFFLANPTLGFSTKFAKKIGVSSGWVDAMGATKVGLRYQVPGTEGGHKCVFARVFSFAPADLPLDDYQLLPVHDRHVAQLNLMIVPQGTVFHFELIHPLNAMEHIALVPLDPSQLLALRHPFLAEFEVNQYAAHQMVGQLQPEVLPANQDGPMAEVRLHQDFQNQGYFSSFSFHSQHPEGIDVQRQAEITQQTLAALRELEAGQARPSVFREIFRNYRLLGEQAQQTRFALHIPYFGLQPNQAVGIQIRNVNSLTQEPKGGITLIITGEGGEYLL